MVPISVPTVNEITIIIEPVEVSAGPVPETRSMRESVPAVPRNMQTRPITLIRFVCSDLLRYRLKTSPAVPPAAIAAILIKVPKPTMPMPQENFLSDVTEKII